MKGTFREEAETVTDFYTDTSGAPEDTIEELGWVKRVRDLVILQEEESCMRIKIINYDKGEVWKSGVTEGNRVYKAYCAIAGWWGICKIVIDT